MAWAAVLSKVDGGSVVVDFLFIVTTIVGVCNCSMFCGTLLYVHSRFVNILMGKRELVALLSLSSLYLAMVMKSNSGYTCLVYLHVHVHEIYSLGPARDEMASKPLLQVVTPELSLGIPF